MADQPLLNLPTQQQIRDELHDLVMADLHGPLGGEDEEFSTQENPIDRYPLGRLAPRYTVIEPETNEDLLGAQPDDESSEKDPEPSAPNVPSLNPSALGFTVHVDGGVDKLVVSGKWARYESTVSERADPHGQPVWRRIRMGGQIDVPLAEGTVTPVVVDKGEPHVVLRGRIRRHAGNWLVSLFLDNAQHGGPKREARLWIFQVELAAEGPDEAPVFLPRLEASRGGDRDDQNERRRLAMAYRFDPEFAFGSGAATHADVSQENPLRATRISTRTVPFFEIPATQAASAQADPDLSELADLELDMRTLADLAEQSAEALVSGLAPLVSAYRSWIERRKADVADPGQYLHDYADQARENLAVAARAADRIEAGIDLLRLDDRARQAFSFANRAMYLQRLHTQVAAERRDDPSQDFQSVVKETEKRTRQRWRPFQLAFVLLNLPSLTDPNHPERSDTAAATADLLWFPTGGGKTEAYLGLTAFAIAVRRLQPQYADLNGAAGVSVLMRYTLRLLTIQQFERAATLVCAAEVLRRADERTWGDTPFRIGMWVGAQVTPNSTDDAEDWLKRLKSSGGSAARSQGSLDQLSTCPWCGERIDAGADISVNRVFRRTIISCSGFWCPFTNNLSSGVNPERQGLPVLLVDEEIYRHPPALLISTVDKFARLPWVGETAAIFGRIRLRCERHGYVTVDSHAKVCGGSERHGPNADAPAARISRVPPLRPPDLIVQDELHLISGPLGSLVGLYESAVDKLATWHNPLTDGDIRPKVVASTATVRRANRQIGSLFNRRTEVFPPPGLLAKDNFFARQRDAAVAPGRRYVGICAHGTRIKSTLIRVYVSVLGAAQKLHIKYGRNSITDPYMTLVGYFNSLRDLGGMRRLAEDDVSSRLIHAADRGLARRSIPIIKELTSRLSSDEIRPLLDQLQSEFPRTKGKKGLPPIDVLLATNMIAVGVDVSRLGAMVVCSQPKSTAEYIQATSRVGRAAPGIVFTVYNWARPRDLSHYESFEHFHATVYRHVEALSVTPFADRAIDRGLTGVLVSLVRNWDVEMSYNDNRGAQSFVKYAPAVDHLVRYLKRRAETVNDRQTGLRVDAELESRLTNWDQQRAVPGRRLVYSQPKNVDDEAAFLHGPTDGPWRQTTCPTSLRDVEPGIPLLLRPPDPQWSPQNEPAFSQPTTPDGETSDEEP